MLHASQRPPRHADCRGGVFATRRLPRPLPPYAHPMPHMAMGGFYNDAACRVVIPPSRLPPMGAYGHYHGTGREGTRYARHLPYQERNGQSRKLIGM